MWVNCYQAILLLCSAIARLRVRRVTQLIIYVYINMYAYIYIYIMDRLSAKNPSSLIYVRKLFPLITQKSCGDCEASEDLLQSHPVVVLSQ